MDDLLQLLIALDDAGLIRITTDGKHVYAYFRTNKISDELREAIAKFKPQLLLQLKRPCQFRKTCQSKGVLII